MDIFHQYNERFEAVLARSRCAEAFIAFGAVATAGLLAFLPLALELHAIALAWIAVVSLHALRRVRPGVRLAVCFQGQVEVGDSSGTTCAGSFVSPWLVIVRWRPPGAWLARTRLVAPDMLSPEDFRRLRVLLRFGDRPLGPLGRDPKRIKGTDLGMNHGA